MFIAIVKTNLILNWHIWSCYFNSKKKNCLPFIH